MIYKYNERVDVKDICDLRQANGSTIPKEIP